MMGEEEVRDLHKGLLKDVRKKLSSQEVERQKKVTYEHQVRWKNLSVPILSVYF